LSTCRPSFAGWFAPGFPSVRSRVVCLAVPLTAIGLRDEQRERVLGVQRDIKRTMIALLVRTKNGLDEEQRQRLDRLRAAAPR